MALTTYPGDFPDWVALSGNIIAQTAKELAYPLGTSKKKYTWNDKRTTSATAAFMKAINKVFPNRAKQGWSKQCQDGASCDVGSATVIRYCGADTKIPRGLDGQFPRMKKNTAFYDTGIKKSTQALPGDIGMYLNKKSGGHIWINLGGNYIAESNHTSKYFFHIVKKTINNGSSKKLYYCYRMATPIRKYIKQGDVGSEILKLQKFLNWYGNYGLILDGDAGAKTIAAVKDFQAKEGLTADGEFGVKGLAAAQKVTKDIKSAYTGTFPTKTLKSGSKGAQVRYLQRFLNWYGNYELVGDGKFGALTENAVKDFQKNEGLEIDGVWGPKSLAKAKQIIK